MLVQPAPVRIVAQSAVQVPNTGNTNENVLATITIPAGLMGANGRVRITALFSFTNSANNKTCRIRFGGIGGTIYQSQVLTTTTSMKFMAEIANRNAQNSQVSHAAGVTAFGGNATGIVTSAVDTSAAVDVVITAQLALGSETINLESYIVEVIPGS